MTTLAEELAERFGLDDAEAVAEWLIARGVGKRGGRRRSRRDRPEAPEIGKAARRMVRSLVGRAGEGDWEAIEELVTTRAAVADAIGAAIVGAHEFGYSYTELADVLGTSRQAVRQRVQS